MSGGKGGEQKTEIPGWLEDRAKKFMERSDDASKIGYTPYMGPDVAALNPMERQAMQNSVTAADSFGLGGGINPTAGMPEAQDFGGVQGYSSFPIYEQALSELRMRAPGQMEQYEGMFVDAAPGVDSTYYDPSNPEHMEIRDERFGGGEQSQFPPGYEWLQFVQNRGGGFL